MVNISKEVKSLLSSPGKIIITTHKNPDGDAIGSSLALYAYLIKKGHSVSLISPNAYPGFLSWLPGNEVILIFDKDRNECMGLIDDADIIFCLDYSALHRIGDVADPVRKSPAHKIMIDHHPDPVREDFDYMISEINTSSTGELIYDFIEGLGDLSLLDKSIAECIYTGIMTDTGSFSYAANYPRTYEIVASLFRLGIDGEYIHRQVYDTFSEDRLRLLGYCLSEKLVVLNEYATAYITLNQEELDRFNFRVGDTEGIVNFALSIEGIVMAVLMIEKNNKIRLSFRSKGSFSVNEIAREHFKGGGHKNAAGGDSYENMDKTVDYFRSLLPAYKEKISGAKF